jgi:hypothetical protein
MLEKFLARSIKIDISLSSAQYIVILKIILNSDQAVLSAFQL